MRLQPVAEGIYERDNDGKLCFPSTTIPSLTSRKKAKVSTERGRLCEEDSGDGGKASDSHGAADGARGALEWLDGGGSWV